MIRGYRALASVFAALFFLTATPVWSQGVSVRNQPYEGEVMGRGEDALVRIDQIAEALDMEAVQTENGWTFAGVVVPTLEQYNTVYVKLADLKPSGVKIVVNTDFNTIDVYREQAASAKGGGEQPAWSAAGSTAGVTVVYFGAQR